MKTKLQLSAVAILSMALLWNCKPQGISNITPSQTNTGPLLPEKPYDYKLGNDHMTTLGRVLFYDKNLSINNGASCGSCHKQENAFCDNMQFSTGTHQQLTDRNTPSIFSKVGRMFWDGRVGNPNELALAPVRNPVEMDFADMSALCQRLSSLDYYPLLFKNAFGTAAIDSNRIRQALASFMNNFTFSDTKFNRSQNGKAVLTTQEKQGKDLFFGKALCSRCHHIEDNGNTSTGYGVADQESNIGLDLEYKDKGRFKVTGNAFDDGRFMVPVLLNVEHTAPYMHDGRFKTLEEVVEHYNSQIKNHPNLDFQLRDGYGNPKKLNLTEEEKAALVVFLKTLSDPKIFSDERFSNPFLN